MRSRRWVWVTVIVILAVMAVGIGAAVLVRPSDTPSDLGPQPTASPSGSASVIEGVFQLRQVLFQETGRVQLKPPIRPGPAEGGKHATRDMLRVDCGLKARPMQDSDNVILCDADGFRYGLGPSALPAAPVTSATPEQGSDGNWVVAIQLDDAATADFATFTRKLAEFHPPLNQAAIVINGVVVTAPAVAAEISGGTLQITGPLNEQDARALADSLGA
jgi:hypothetical protein